MALLPARAEERPRSIDSTRWWGTTMVPFGAARRWKIGPTTLWVVRRAAEWSVASRSSGDPLAQTCELAAAAALDELSTAEITERFAHADSGEHIELTPRAPDRAVVTRPDHPFWIGAGESATFFASSPLWASLSVNPEHPLCSRPLFRPSDTWFGPRDGDGELCYATTTYCRLVLDEVPYRPHRSITTVQIRNHATTPLLLERLKLPVDTLELYAGEDGRLWTQDVVFEHRNGGEFANVEIAPGVPARARDGVLVADRPKAGTSNVMTRAFSSLFR